MAKFYLTFEFNAKIKANPAIKARNIRVSYSGVYEGDDFWTVEFVGDFVPRETITFSSGAPLQGIEWHLLEIQKEYFTNVENHE